MFSVDRGGRGLECCRVDVPVQYIFVCVVGWGFSFFIFFPLFDWGTDGIIFLLGRKKRERESVWQRGFTHPVLPRRGVDALDPKLPELALLIFPVAVHVLQRLLHAVTCGPDGVLRPPPEPLGQLEDFFRPHFFFPFSYFFLMCPYSSPTRRRPVHTHTHALTHRHAHPTEGGEEASHARDITVYVYKADRTTHCAHFYCAALSLFCEEGREVDDLIFFPPKK